MKRPLFVIGTTFAVTTWFVFLLDASGALQVSVAFTLTGVACMLLKKEYLRLPCLICLSAAIAMGSYNLYYTRSIVPFSKVDGQEIRVEGILLESNIYNSSASYTMLANFPNNPELPQKQYISIRSFERLEYVEGDAMGCVVMIGLPENSGRESYYRSKGIVALGTLRLQHPVDTISVRQYRFQSMWVKLRGAMSANLQTHLTGENSQVVGAMAMGLKGELDPLLYNAVGKSGTAHLLSVSGLHLSILSAFLLGVLRLLRLPRTPRYLLCISLTFCFSVLVGFSSSIIRSFIMTAMMLLGRMISRKNDSKNALGLSLLVISVIWPYWTQGRSLWLSAGSTLGILIFAGTITEALFGFFRLHEEDHRDRFPKMLLRSVAVGVGAYVFSLPILLVTSGWFSLLSPVANMLITPFTTPVILGGVVCAFTDSQILPIRIIALITNFCTDMIIGISSFVADLPFAIFAIDEGYLLIILAGIVAGVAVLLIFRADRKLVGYGLALCVLCFSAGSLSLLKDNGHRMELVTLAGSNGALLIREKQAVLLGAPSRYDIGNLLKYLSFRNIQGISAVIAPEYGSQLDSGILRLCDNYRVDCMIGPDDAYILDMLEGALPNTQVLSGGHAQILVLDTVGITTNKQDGSIFVQVDGETILKTDADYAIIDGYDLEGIEIYRDGIMLLPEHLPPLVEPVGQYLFGEARVLLPIQIG